MNPGLIRAVIVVTVALVFYSIGAITEQRKHAVTRHVLFFLTVGVLLDITSTALMITYSGNIPITVHGVIGYTALLAMLIDAILIWRHWRKNGSGPVSKKLHRYTRIAYGWWVIAYIAGAIISSTL
ncbi:MAG: hypothetical protein A2Y92_01915 [Chloroflexi bacterium RBG_13_57_8]|nr:MAG: hypothetical protein A2Y92_01915 [Chloroflexi bacterium RBG_13_57_8]